MIQTYVTKPVVVQAVQLTPDNINEVLKFMNWRDYSFSLSYGLVIPTKGGQLHASIGDFIIKGVQGEFYPCKPDSFTLTYEVQE